MLCYVMSLEIGCKPPIGVFILKAITRKTNKGQYKEVMVFFIFFFIPVVSLRIKLGVIKYIAQQRLLQMIKGVKIE